MVQECIWVANGLLPDDRLCGNAACDHFRNPCPGICVEYELDKRVPLDAQWRAVRLEKGDCSPLMTFKELIEFLMGQKDTGEWRVELADPADAELIVMTELTDEERMVCGEWQAACEQMMMENNSRCERCDAFMECSALDKKLNPKKDAKVHLVQKQVIDISPNFDSPADALHWLTQKAKTDKHFNQGDWFLEVAEGDK